MLRLRSQSTPTTSKARWQCLAILALASCLFASGCGTTLPRCGSQGCNPSGLSQLLQRPSQAISKCSQCPQQAIGKLSQLGCGKDKDNPCCCETGICCHVCSPGMLPSAGPHCNCMVCQMIWHSQANQTNPMVPEEEFYAPEYEPAEWMESEFTSSDFIPPESPPLESFPLESFPLESTPLESTPLEVDSPIQTSPLPNPTDGRLKNPLEMPKTVPLPPKTTGHRLLNTYSDVLQPQSSRPIHADNFFHTFANRPSTVGSPIESVVSPLVNPCDCKTCSLLGNSRVQAISHLDEECDTVDTAIEALPPPMDLPSSVRPMLRPPQGGWADRHIKHDEPSVTQGGLTNMPIEYGNAEPYPPSECQLDLDAVACAAARNSPIANLLNRESQIVGQQQNPTEPEGRFRRLHRQRDCEDPCATAMRQKVMRYQALAQRNESSANALSLLLAIAETDAQAPLIDEALTELLRNKSRIAALRSEKLDVPLDATELQRQQNRLESERERLKLARDQATEQLRVLIGCDLCPHGSIHPIVNLVVNTTPLQHELEVSEGLDWRADVATCEHLRHCLNDETLDSVRKALSLSSALIGTPACPPSLRSLCRLFCCDDDSHVCEIQQRRRQLNDLCCETRRQAQSEIRQAALEVDANARLVLISESTLASWKKRVKDLRLLQEADKATAFEVTAAELERIQTKSDLITAKVNWKRAHVELAKAKGQLPVECGYRVPNPCQCCE